MRLISRICLVLLITVVATAAYAGETGSISGVVKDGSGLPVPGASVTIAGAQAPRNTVTSASGGFKFGVLLPGDYVVSAELKGLGNASQKVHVFVDNDAQVSLALLQTAKTEVVVTGAAAEIDKKASEVNFNYTDNVIKELPLTRTYQGLIKMVPGVPTDQSGIGDVSISGGTRQDNKFLLDGVNITNPGYGNLGSDTNQLDIADFNVKKGGITAEFGRTMGAMFNAVTKSGTNEVAGSVLANISPHAFQANNCCQTTQETSNYNGQGNLGFPIIKDTLFGYVSGAYYDNTASGQSATVAAVTTTQPDSKSHNGDYFGKLTFFGGQNLLVNAGFRALPSKSSNQFGSVYDAPTSGYGQDNTNYVGNLSVDWFASKDTVAEVKYINYQENDLSQAQNVLTSMPTIDPKNLAAYGEYDLSGPTRNTGVYQFINYGDKYRRNEVKGTLSQYLDLGPTQNQFKLGGGYEVDSDDVFRQSNGWALLNTGSTCPAVVCGTAKPGYIRARYYPTQPVQYADARTYSAFLQDTITFKNVTVYLGVLANKDDFAQVCKPGITCGTTVPTAETRYNFMTFDWSKEIQPRLGITWNPNLIGGDKFYSSYGEYAGVDQKSTARSFAPYRISQSYAFFDPTTGVYQGTQIRASSSGKYIPPGLKPPYYQEWILGYSAAVTKDISFDAYYQYRNLKNAMEDTPINPNNSGSLFQAANFPDARRVYRAFTLDVQKRYADHWYADANITFSKLYGNFDDDTGIGTFNTSSVLEDGPGFYTSEPNRYGRLSADRPIIAKLMGSYDFPFGVTLGGLLRVQSGTPWQPLGADPNSSSGYGRYLLPAGTYRLPTWTTFDLLGAYTFKPTSSLGIRLEARVTNVFNTQTVLSVDQVEYLDPYVNGTPYSVPGPQGTSKPNPNYGNASSWAAPRRFVLTARLDF
jgi:hypothetical protein